MATAMQDTTGPVRKTASPWNSLWLFWGAVMLTLYTLWLSKFVALVPVGAEPSVRPVAPPPDWVKVVLWVVTVFSYLLAIWYFLSLRLLTLKPDLAAEAKLNQRLGVILILSGLVLEVFGFYLVFTLRLAGFAESVGLCLFGLIPMVGGLALQQAPGAGDLVSFALPRADLIKLVLLLLGVAGIGTFLVLVGFMKVGTTWLPELGSLVFESMLLITCGLWLQTSQEKDRTPLAMRCLLLILGGVTGLFLTLLALARTIYWRQTVLLGGISGWMGPNSWEFWMCAYIGLVGLTLIFGAMLLARTEVRNQPWLRQAYFGYNAVATGLLLIAFLAAINVLVYAMFPYTMEWSSRGLISLAPASHTILASIKKEPITAYVLLSQNSIAYNDVKNLLDNCQAAAPADKFIIKYVSPDSSDSGLYEELAERFPEIRAASNPFKRETQRGILLVEGPLPKSFSEKVAHYAFISERRISDVEIDRERGGQKRVFKGEMEIMRELNFILRAKEKNIIYILQGDDELAVDERNPQNGAGCASLVERLVKDNYIVKAISFNKPPLKKDKFDRSDIQYIEEGKDKLKNVPSDAWALLVLGPGKKMPRETIDALDRFMQHNGRMLVTLKLDVTKDEKELQQSGMEEFLQKFGVECDMRNPNDGFLIRAKRGGSLFDALAIPPPRSTNDFAKKFFGKGFTLVEGVRVVRAGEAGRFKGEPLLVVDKDVGNDNRPYAVDNRAELLTSLEFQNRYFFKPPGGQSEAERHIVDEPIPVAVAVSEEIKPGESRPRLVVIGNTWFASNPLISLQARNYSLVIGPLEWMGERPVTGILPKEEKTFQLPATARVDRMIWTPLWLMWMATIGLATGVWLVRRR